MLKSAKGSFRLEKKDSCSNAKATKKEEPLVKDELPVQDASSNSESEEETERDLIKQCKKYKESMDPRYPCPYCDWWHCPYCDWWNKKGGRYRSQQRLHVLTITSPRTSSRLFRQCWSALEAPVLSVVILFPKE